MPEQVEMDFKIDLWWNPESPLAASASDEARDPNSFREGFIPADGHWNDDHYNGDAGHGMDSCGCFGCYVVYGMFPLCNNRQNDRSITNAATTVAGAFTGGDPGEGHVEFTAADGEFIFAINIGGPGGMLIGDAFFVGDVDAERLGLGFRITNTGLDESGAQCGAECDYGINLIVDWQQCSAGWSLQGGTGHSQCDAARSSETSCCGSGCSGTCGSGCCSNSFGGSSNDLALAQVLDSLRWSNAGHDSTRNSRIDMEVSDLRVGWDYKLQLLFQERCCMRGFDILVNDEVVVRSFSPLRTQGGVSAQGEGSGAGAFVAHEFTASSSSLRVTLQGESASEAFPDHNAIINGVTLQHVAKESVRLPEHVIADPENVHLAALSGGDPGENGDFQGTFVFAVNVGPAADVGNLPVGDAIFTNDQRTEGFRITGSEEIAQWGDINVFNNKYTYVLFSI